MGREKGTNRRDFIRKCMAGALVLGAGDTLSFGKAKAETAAGPKSKVVVAKGPMLRGNGGTVDSGRVANLLDTAMQRFFDSSSTLYPWKQLVKPGEVIALKVNAIAGPVLSTNVELVQAICERLQQAGIKPSDIIIWDRTTGELERAGYKQNLAHQIRLMGNDESGFEDRPENFGVASCRLSKILTRISNGVINVPILKHHGSAGVTASMKNMYGVIDNPRDCHANRCNPHIADISCLPSIRQKIRFTICDITTSVFEGGPKWSPQYACKYESLMVARDPVALDFCGWQILDRMRAEKGLKSMAAAGCAPEYIATAADARHQLGTNDPNRITLVQV
jgi:uncharacterized protein (DUF362 family)